jgi:CarD family transcriptional regulator
MYQVGDRFIYGIHGVCEILELQTQRVSGKAIQYYVLQPKSQPNDRFYVPVSHPVAVSKLRPIMSAQEINQVLLSPEVRHECWIADENMRKQHYRELICSGNPTQLLRMIYTLYCRKKQQLDTGRKLHLCDENFLRDAKRLIDSEFSFVLGIEPNEVGTYIRAKFDG